MGALDEILATIRRLPLPERLRLIERATLEVAEDTPTMTVREILDAIHALPRPDRLRLVDLLNDEAMSDRLSAVELQPPSGSMLDLVDGFYVYTGPLSDPGLDHRADREARIDHVIARLDAPRT